MCVCVCVYAYVRVDVNGVELESMLDAIVARAHTHTAVCALTDPTTCNSWHPLRTTTGPRGVCSRGDRVCVASAQM